MLPHGWARLYPTLVVTTPKYVRICCVDVFVLTLTHRHNAVRGHMRGSNNSGAEDYLRRKTNKNTT